MNCLQLVTSLQGQVGGSVDLPLSGPSTLVGATGQYLELFNWIRTAYRDIQNDNETGWRWRNKQGELAIVAAQNVYTLANIQAQLSDYEDLQPLHFIDDQRHLLIYDPVVGKASQTQCFYILYQDYRGWKDRNIIPTTKPVYYTIHDDQSIEFYGIPDKNYTVTLDYSTTIDDFPVAAGGILPGTGVDAYSPKYLPARFHDAIVWKAAMYWSKQRQNGAKYAAFKEEYERVMAKLYSFSLPDMQPYLMEYYG